MSRYTLSAKPDKLILHMSDGPFPKVFPTRKEKYTLMLVFGFDHALGVFFQILKETSEFNADGTPKMELCVDQDSLFHHVTKSHLLEIIKYYASAEELERFEHVLLTLAVDLPF